MRRLFAVQGMACGGCARGVEKRLSRIEGVNAVGVHHLTASMLIDWDETRLKITGIAAAVAGAGYTLIERHRPDELSAILAADIRLLGLRLAIAVMAGMWSMALAVVLYTSSLEPLVAWRIALASGLLALPVVFWSGAGIFWMALRSIRLRAPGMDLLIALGAGGAFALSVASLVAGSSHVYFDTATMLITLLLVGRLLDAITRRGALDALKALEDASAETVLRRTAFGDETVQCAQVNVGDCVVIDAGSIISVDGTLQAGATMVDRAVLTGESRPVPIGAGQRVEAGSVNLQRRIVVTVDRAHGDRDIDRMGGAIALELARRGTTASRADCVADSLSWGIPTLALLTAVLALLFGAPPIDAALRGLSVLAAACPCALSIAAPLAQARAANLAARLGLRLRDPAAFEALACPATAIFDKTGTLTSGRPAVVSVIPEAGWSEADVLRLAARAETGIDHPLARAIVERHGQEEGGCGTRLQRSAEATTSDGRHITVRGLDRKDGLTSLAVTLEDVAVGTLQIADEATGEARAALQRLRGMGVEILIASGDACGPTLEVASALAVPPAQVRFSCTPADKADLVKAAVAPVVFVGDGVNDAPALAAADCGISVASAHSAAAQTADVVIVKGGIGQLLTAVDLARATASITRQNLGLALIYNLIAIPFAISGVLPPSLAALAMLASSVSVAMNSLRLKRPAAAAISSAERASMPGFENPAAR